MSDTNAFVIGRTKSTELAILPSSTPSEIFDTKLFVYSIVRGALVGIFYSDEYSMIYLTKMRSSCKEQLRVVKVEQKTSLERIKLVGRWKRYAVL